jgi:hypothetical protein
MFYRSLLVRDLLKLLISCHYRFPKDEVERWKWLEHFGIEPTDPRLHSEARICEIHFSLPDEQNAVPCHQRRKEFSAR